MNYDRLVKKKKRWGAPYTSGSQDFWIPQTSSILKIILDQHWVVNFYTAKEGQWWQWGKTIVITRNFQNQRTLSQQQCRKSMFFLKKEQLASLYQNKYYIHTYFIVDKWKIHC